MIGLGVGIDYALFIVTRYRQNLHDGMEPLHAIGLSSATAGQAVVFSGIMVSIALLGLWISGIAFVGMMATAAAIVVLVAVVAAVTLLPAFLGFAGNAIDKLSVHRRRTTEDELEGKETMWSRWGHEVERHPWRYFVSAATVLVVLAIPLFSMKLGFPDDGTAPKSETRRLAYDLLSEGFGPGFNGPLLLAVELDDPAALQQLDQLTTAIAATPGVAAVSPPQPNEAGDAAIIQVIPTTSPQDQATTELVRRLRDDVIPAATPEGAVVHVGGGTATFIDLSDRITNALPWFIGAVVLLSFLLLMVVFRSILVPLKAAVLNLLSIGAAYGVVVMIFQWGWGRSLLGIDQLIPIVSFVPMMMFAVLFGLSMDYEVFLLSRIREEYLKTGNNVESVVSGISTTARVITSAALIMIAVFLSFVTQPDPVAKMFGIGLAVAVLIDATIVRIVLVPATMVLLGRRELVAPRLAGPDPAEDEPGVRLGSRGRGGAGPGRIDPRRPCEIGERDGETGVGVGVAGRSGVDAHARSGRRGAAGVRGDRRARDEPRRPAGRDPSGDRPFDPRAPRGAPAIPPRLGMPPSPPRRHRAFVEGVGVVVVAVRTDASAGNGSADGPG